MTSGEIRAAILDSLHQIAPEADLQALAPDENVREALDIDSFDFLTFLINLDKTVGVEIPEADYAQLTTLTEMERYITARAK